MEECPEPYSTNCRWLGIKCKECSASREGEELRLLYQPISKLYPFSSHPKEVERKRLERQSRARLAIERKSSNSYKKGKKNYIKGRADEARVIKDLGAKSTVASGAVCGDGDGVLKIGDINLSIEHKSRIGSKGKLSVTTAEWEKGKRQGIDVFIISSDEQRVVIMDYQVFVLIKEAISNV